MIYRHNEEMIEERLENMRGGKGAVTIKHLLKADEMLGKGRLFTENTISVGSSIGLHPHEGEVEAYYFTQGSGIYHNNDQKLEVKAGDLTLVDDHNSHGLENTGEVPLVFIALILFKDIK
ncbi:MAG TPA: cupin domain-containing protein [Ruminiclostridium sp.]